MPKQKSKHMVAFKEEFPYLRCDSGQLFEFDQAWLHAAITRAADQAGYPRWWLTDHVTESIAFYLRLRNDESVVPFDQLSQTVRYVLKVIGYKEIVPFFVPSPPPVSFSLLEIAQEAGAGYELAFFDGLEKRISALVSARAVARAFTYEVGEEVGKGAIVSIPFGRRRARDGAFLTLR